MAWFGAVGKFGLSSMRLRSKVVHRVGGSVYAQLRMRGSTLEVPYALKIGGSEE